MAHVLGFEAVDAQIGDAGLQPEGIHHAGFDLAAGDFGGDEIGRAFALHGDPHLGALGAAQHVGDVGGIHAGGVLAVHRRDDVAAAQIGIPGGRAGERLHDHHPVAGIHADHHADAEILGALPALHLAVFGGIDEIGVRVERAQHARNGALVEGLFRRDRVGEILFDQRVGLGHRVHGLGQIIGRRCGRGATARFQGPKPAPAGPKPLPSP